MTFCIPGLWLSVKVASAPIEYVGVIVYRPWSADDGLGPHEVWLGDAFGDKKTRCAPREEREPSHGCLLYTSPSPRDS